MHSFRLGEIKLCSLTVNFHIGNLAIASSFMYNCGLPV